MMDEKRDKEDTSGVRQRSTAENHDTPTEVGNNHNYNTVNNSGNNNDQSCINDAKDSASKAESNALAGKGNSFQDLEETESNTNTEDNDPIKDAEGNDSPNNTEGNNSRNNAEGNDSTNNSKDNDSTKNNEVSDPVKYPDRGSAVLGADGHNETNVANFENAKKHPKRQLRYRIVKTGCLVTTWFCIGLFTELSGPTFKDLELRLNLPSKEATEAVSRATSGRSLGFMAGAIIGGFLVDRFKRKGDLFIAISLCCASAFTVAVPWMSSFATMWFMMFCQGTFEGIINIAGQEIILLLWGEKSAGPMHLLHFGFGMGSFINPLIAQPFLATEIPTNVTDLGHTSSFNTSNVTTVETLVGSRIEYAYLIAALVSASFSSTFFWFQCKGVPHGGYVEDHSGPKQSTKPVKTGCKQYISLIDPATCADGKRLAGFSIFALLFIYFFQAVGGERIYSKFIRNFALDQLHFSSSEATYLNSSFWISFSIGRFLGFVVAIWVPIRILIMVECFSGLGFAILLNVLGHNSKLAVWVLTQPMALFIAPLFPSGVAWSDHYLKMSGIGITILIAGGSIGGAAYIWILGFVYPNYGPQTFLYIVAVYSAAACVSVSLMSFAGCLHGDRFQKQRMEMEMEPDKDDNKTVTYITSESLEDLKP